jgi:hypothetical protein
MVRVAFSSITRCPPEKLVFPVKRTLLLAAMVKVWFQPVLGYTPLFRVVLLPYQAATATDRIKTAKRVTDSFFMSYLRVLLTINKQNYLELTVYT